MDEIVKFETAKLAKEKGFNIFQPTFYNRIGDFHKSAVAGYDFTSSEHNVVAPTQSLLQKWLREEHNINIGLTYFDAKKWKNQMSSYWECRLHYNNILIDGKTYEEALEKGLIQALKMI